MVYTNNMKILTNPKVVYQKVTEEYEVEINGENYIVYYESDCNGSDITVYNQGERTHDEDILSRIQFMRDYTYESFVDIQEGQEFLEEDFKEWKN